MSPSFTTSTNQSITRQRTENVLSFLRLHAEEPAKHPNA
jgi:hypothetical protein